MRHYTYIMIGQYGTQVFGWLVGLHAGQGFNMAAEKTGVRGVKDYRLDRECIKTEMYTYGAGYPISPLCAALKSKEVSLCSNLGIMERR